jgi:hypothetical protein
LGDKNPDAIWTFPKKGGGTAKIIPKQSILDILVLKPMVLEDPP